VNNIKKFTQKDRYGNMMSFEFDVPPMESIPHPGMPIGTDTVPAWLTPGERVMNAEAERMYGPALEQMNEHGRAIQRAQGGTIPEYAAMGCKVKYKAAGGPVYAQEGMSPEQMSALLANQVLSGALDPRTAEAALANMGMGQGQAQAVTPSFALPQVPPTDYEAEALMGVRSYPEVPTSPQTLNTELPPIRPQQQPTPTDYEGDVYSGRRDYPEVPQVPGTLDAEPPQKYSDRVTQTRELLIQQEGYKTKPYKDTEGNWTVGAGHKITDKDILNRLNNNEDVTFTDDQLMGFFEKDLNTATEGAQKNFEGFNNYSPELQDALISMNYQLGTAGTAKFKEFKKALAEGNYAKAKAELDNSNWAKQTPARVEYLKSVIDKQAAQSVGNKNTITSESGQPVVDSRFGIESTYQGQDVTPEVPPVTEAPQMIDEFGIEQRDVAGGEGQVNPEVLQQKKIVEYNRYVDQEIAQGRKPESFDMWEFENYTTEGGRQAGTIQNEMAPPAPSIVEEAATPVDEFGNISRDLQAEPKTDVVPEISQGVIKTPAEIAAQETPPDVTQEQKKAAETVINQNQNEPNPYTDGMDDEQAEAVASNVETTGQQVANSNPQALNTITEAFKGAFGSLFDPQEMARMAIMYLGSRAMGYSHGGSLNFAAKNYIKRVDTKVSNREKIAQSQVGKSTPESIKKYLQTGDLGDLKAIATTKLSKDFVVFNVKGKPVNGYWDETSQQFYARDSQGGMFTIPPNTPKFKDDKSAETFAKWTKDSRAMVNSVIDDAFEGKDKPELGFITGAEIATQSASYFKNRGISIKDAETLYNMDAIVQNATRAAAEYASNNQDKKVSSIEPFLAQATAQAIVGTDYNLFMIDPTADPEDIEYVDPKNISKVMKSLESIALEQTENPTAARSKRDELLTRASYVWNNLPTEEQKKYGSPGEGENGFYLFLRTLLSDNKLTEEELTVKEK